MPRTQRAYQLSHPESMLTEEQLTALDLRGRRPGGHRQPAFHERAREIEAWPRQGREPEQAIAGSVPIRIRTKVSSPPPWLSSTIEAASSAPERTYALTKDDAKLMANIRALEAYILNHQFSDSFEIERNVIEQRGYNKQALLKGLLYAFQIAELSLEHFKDTSVKHAILSEDAADEIYFEQFLGDTANLHTFEAEVEPDKLDSLRRGSFKHIKPGDHSLGKVIELIVLFGFLKTRLLTECAELHRWNPREAATMGDHDLELQRDRSLRCWLECPRHLAYKYGEIPVKLCQPHITPVTLTWAAEDLAPRRSKMVKDYERLWNAVKKDGLDVELHSLGFLNPFELKRAYTRWPRDAINFETMGSNDIMEFNWNREGELLLHIGDDKWISLVDKDDVTEREERKTHTWARMTWRMAIALFAKQIKQIEMHSVRLENKHYELKRRNKQSGAPPVREERPQETDELQFTADDVDAS